MDYIAENNPLIISGIHRSGTSLLSKILENQDIFIGRYKDINNESIFFQNINNQIMYEYNSSWDNPKSIFKSKSSINLDVLISKIKFILNNPLNNYQYFGASNFFRKNNFKSLMYNWGWKDPRNIFTLPLWLKIFPKAKVVIMIRHPYDVSNSLIYRNEKNKRKLFLNLFRFIPTAFLSLLPMNNKSNKISNSLVSFHDGIKLYEKYYFEIESLKLKYPDKLYILKYEDLVLDPVKTINCICKYLGMKISKKNIKFLETISKERAYNFKSIDKSRFKDYENNVKKYGY